MNTFFYMLVYFSTWFRPGVKQVWQVGGWMDSVVPRMTEAEVAVVRGGQQFSNQDQNCDWLEVAP